ncbi:hypothetical protein [Alloalcanivorax xenomutans]|uniref:hypothetical protein n=1 Tax=Alloalcanivorax xenomutans TaxID=1094342 RepID=UPI001F363E75|nr:hypothetical protein [Alloalcanivorax xenomutans]MCE7525188.1 hypothetical protein [Alloalcanivorax xenomutans]
MIHSSPQPEPINVQPSTTYPRYDSVGERILSPSGFLGIRPSGLGQLDQRYVPWVREAQRFLVTPLLQGDQAPVLADVLPLYLASHSGHDQSWCVVFRITAWAVTSTPTPSREPPDREVDIMVTGRLHLPALPDPSQAHRLPDVEVCDSVEALRLASLILQCDRRVQLTFPQIVTRMKAPPETALEGDVL